MNCWIPIRLPFAALRASGNGGAVQRSSLAAPAVAVLLLLLLPALSMALDPVPTANAPVAASAALGVTVEAVRALVIGLMVVMVVLAAVVYVVGSLFGSETRARASVWAQGMLAAVLVSGALIVLLNIFLPNMSLSGSPIGGGDLLGATRALWALANQVLAGLVVTLFVIGVAVYIAGSLLGAEARAQATVWSTGIFAGAIFAALLYSLGTVILQPFAQGLQIGIIADYQELIISVMMFLFIVMLITYLIAKVFKVPEWEAYLSVELSNLISCFLILFFVIGFFKVGEAVSLSMMGYQAVPASVKTAPQAAIYLLRQEAAPQVLTGMFDIFKVQTCASVLSTFAKRIGEFVLTNTFKIFPGVDTLVSIANVVGYGLVAIYGSLSAQITLLALVDGTMYQFFLPAGLVLRFFPPTRDAGGFLIAFAIGFQVIFPASYIINGMVLKDMQSQLGLEPYRTPNLLIGSLCGPVKFGVLGYLFNPSTWFSSTILQPLKLSLVFKNLTSEGILNLVVMMEFIPILKALAGLTLVAIFMPALSMIITIAFINATTKFLVAKV